MKLELLPDVTISLTWAFVIWLSIIATVSVLFASVLRWLFQHEIKEGRPLWPRS